LAYFAKGPLSRARAAFHLDYDSTLDMNGLIGFLEDLVLPTNTADKKYKDGVPSLVSSLIIGDGSADDAGQSQTKTKKLKAKKMRPGKNGLYPAEEVYIRRWWASHDADADIGTPGTSKEDIVRRRVAKLRIRETQLQMIVILETLALRPLAAPQNENNGDLPAIGQSGGVSDDKASTQRKPKKALDLAVLIDVLVDRLCIWQSVAAEDGRTLVEKAEKVENTSVDTKPGGLAGTREHIADVLRDFCVEVIVPL